MLKYVFCKLPGIISVIQKKVTVYYNTIQYNTIQYNKVTYKALYTHFILYVIQEKGATYVTRNDLSKGPHYNRNFKNVP